MENILISVVIPTYNRADLLRSALQSVAASRDVEADRVEVLVIDNNSVDDTRAVVDEIRAAPYPFPLRYVLETRQGLSHARNRGAAEAAGFYLVFMDDDQMIHERYLAHIEPAFTATGADCIGGPVRYYNATGLPEWLPPLLEHVGQFDLGGETRALSEHDDVLRGGNMVIPKALLASLGGFDVRLGRVGTTLLSDEETELQARMRRGGHRIVYVPALVQHHYLDPDRLSRHHWRRHRFDYGRTIFRRRLADGDFTAGRTFLGVPRWLWLQMLTRELRLYGTACLLRREDRFDRQLRLCECLGQMYQARENIRTLERTTARAE
ncbi:glycosyltransferase family 2 protein [Salinisphaera orenii]|uniref:Glycosyltransferase 2-like domain-containing protein n=1 Tax=Salinisphaera orenii YIM 95161 TaxID=1051139 RepID=A0A423PDL6_9GAMM|nr:glycosyltransferase [Salinisphaera halophila]ROO23091.1 hypothetical protein SAHL_16900 [Salinisphaera halophila YIM 95161]